MALKSGKFDTETASFPRLRFSSFTSTSGILDRVLEGWSWAIFWDPRISTSSSTLVAVWGESLENMVGGAMSWASVWGLAALPDSSSMSSVVTAGIAVSRGGEGDFHRGELLPVAGSSKVALALKRKVSRRLTWLQKSEDIEKEKQKEEVLCCLPSVDLEVFRQFGHAFI